MVAGLANEESSIEYQANHSSTAKVAVSDQGLNNMMWAPKTPQLCLAASNDVNHLRGYGLHEQGSFGPLPYLLKMAHPPFPFASVYRIPLDALTDFHRSQYETEGALVWKEKKLSESKKENYIAQKENAVMRGVLNSTGKDSSINTTKVVGGITKRLKQSTQPKALAYKQAKQQYSSVEKRKQALKAITLREQLVNVEGRDDILDFSMLNESAQCLLDLNPDDYQSFRESNDRLDAIVRGTNIHLPSRWHYLSYGLTAPFFRIGRILAGCARRNEQAIDERKSGHKPLNQKRGFFYKVSRMVDRAPFVLGGWFGLSYFFMSLFSAHSFAGRCLKERKEGKQLKTEKHQEKRRGYLRDEAYGDFKGWAKCIDEYKDLPWSYNRFFAFLGRFLTGDDDGVFGKRKQKRNDYFAKLNNMINEGNNEGNIEEKDWLNEPPPAIPKAWQVFLSSCQYKLSKGRFFLSQASKSSISYRYQALRDIRRGYVEKKRTLKALDKGLTGVASLRPSWWARSMFLQSVVAVLRCLLMPLGITWLFGFWHKKNPVSEARASYKIWKSNVDSLLLAMNARSKLNRRGISQFKALAQHANGEVLADKQQNKGSLFADNVTDNDAFSVRRITEQDLDAILEKLERKYGKQVSKLKPSDERRQAYANIIYGIAVKSPDVLLKLENNPIVNVPDALLERVVRDNAVRGEDRADSINLFNKTLCNDPMQIINNIAKIFAKPTLEDAPLLEGQEQVQAEAQGNKSKMKKIKKHWFGLKRTRDFFHRAAKLFKKSPQRPASGILYSHREFLDITNNRAMRSLSNRIELLRAISGRLEALNDHQAKIIINGLSYHASGVRSCLDACTAFIQNKQQSITESNKLLLLNIGKAINDCNEENYLGIDVTFSYTDPTLRVESNVDRNPQCSCAMRLSLNESRYHVIHDQDLQILTGRQDIDNVIQTTIEHNVCPSEVPAVRSLWKELNPSVMKLHLKIQNFLIENKVLDTKTIQFNSDILLKKMAYQIINHLRIVDSKKSVKEYLPQEVTLGSVSFKLSDLMPGPSSEKSAKKNGHQVKDSLLAAFNEARNNSQRTFSLNIQVDNLDENVTIALAELYMPSQEELTHLHISLLKLTEAQKNCLLEDLNLSNAIQGSDLVLRNMTTQGDKESTGEANSKANDNLMLFNAYLELISHSVALTQNMDDMRSKEAGVLHGTDSIDKKSGKVFDLLSRNFLRLYTEICSRQLSLISYRFEVSPKLTQTLDRLLKNKQISDEQRVILTELQNRINLKDVSPISNKFIQDVASLLSFNLLQKQDKLFPIDKVNNPSEHIVKSVLAENALLKWSNATGHIDTIANAVEVLSRPNFEEEKVSCCITFSEASSSNTTQEVSWIWTDSMDPSKNKMRSLTYYENGKANYNQSIKLALLHYDVTVSNESNVFSVLEQLINKYLEDFNASEHQSLIKSIQKFYDRSEVEIKYLLKHVCFTNEFTTIVKMALNQLSGEENNKSKYLVLFWSILADLAEESRDELSINHAGKIAFSHDQALALRGIPIQKDLNACEKRLSKYIAGLKNINQATRTFVIPPAATQELEAIVAPIDDVAMSQDDALNKLLLLLPHSFQDLYKHLKNNQMEHLFISKLAKDITPKYAFKLSGLGLASPELWNSEQVTFRKSLDGSTFTDMSIRNFVSLVFACDDNNAISSINLGNQEIRRADSKLGGRIGSYEEVTITLTYDVNNRRNTKRSWTDNKYIGHIENLLTTQDESFSNLADFRVMSLFNGIHAHLYQLMTNIIKTMTDVSALGENIMNADIKHLFALASKILPAIPEKKRPYFYAQCVQCILTLNQRWYDAVGLLRGGLTPIEIAEDAKLLDPLLKSQSARIRVYEHRIEQLLLQVKSANASEYAINFDKRVTSRLILPPTEIGYDTHFINMLKVIEAALKAYDNSLNKNFSDFINEKDPFSSIGNHLESIHSLVNNVHNSLTTDPSILNQAVAYGLDLAQIIRFLGIGSTDKTLKEAISDLEKYQKQAVDALTDKNTINFPQLLSLTVLNREMQLNSLKTIVADKVSSNLTWKNEEKLANVCGFDKSKSHVFVLNLATTINSVLRAEAQSKDSRPATEPTASALHQYNRFIDTIQSLRVAFAAGMTDLANNIFSTDSEENLAATVRKIIKSSNVFDQMRLCDLLPGLSDYSSTNDIKLIATSAKNIIINLTSIENQEKSLKQSCIKIDLVVTFFAHLGLDDEAKKLIILFFKQLLDNYKDQQYNSINLISENKQHPVRTCINNWGADPAITKVIATLKPGSIDWMQHNTFLSTKSHDQNFMTEKSRIHILILVAQVLICSKPSEIVPVPVKNINGTVAHKGSLILQKVMDFVHNCASNKEYETLLEILKKTVLVQNHSDWCWHYVAGNYFTELDSLIAQPEASSKDLLKNFEPKATIFSALYNVLGIKQQPNVQKLGMKLLQVLMTRMLSPDYPDKPLQEKIIECAFKEDATLTTDSFSSMVCDFPAMINAAMDYHNLNEDEMKKFIRDETKRLKEVYTLNFGDPKSKDEDNLVRTKLLNINKKTTVPVVPKFIIHLIRLITLESEHNQFLYQTVGPWISMAYGLNYFDFFVDAKKAGFEESLIIYEKRIDACQPFGFLGPKFMKDLEIIVNRSRSDNREKNDLHALKKWTFKNIKEENKDEVAKLVLKMFEKHPDKMFLLTFLPGHRVFSKFISGKNPSINESRLINASESSIFGGTSLAKSEPFATLFFGIWEKVMAANILNNATFLNTSIPGNLSLHTLADMISRGQSQRQLRQVEVTLKRQNTLSDKLSLEDPNLVQNMFLKRLELAVLYFQLSNLKGINSKKSDTTSIIRKQDSFNDLICALQSALQNNIAAINAQEFEPYFNCNGQMKLPDSLVLGESFNVMTQSLAEAGVMNEANGIEKIFRTIIQGTHAEQKYIKTMNRFLLTILSSAKKKQKSFQIKALTNLKNMLVLAYSIPNNDINNSLKNYSACWGSQKKKFGKTKIVINSPSVALRALVLDGFRLYLAKLQKGEINQLIQKHKDVNNQFTAIKAEFNKSNPSSIRDALVESGPCMEKFTGDKTPGEVKSKMMNFLITMEKTYAAYNDVYVSNGVKKENVNGHKENLFNELSASLIEIYKFFETTRMSIGDKQVSWSEIMVANRLLPPSKLPNSAQQTILYVRALQMRDAIPVPNALLLPTDRRDDESLEIPGRLNSDDIKAIESIQGKPSQAGMHRHSTISANTQTANNTHYIPFSSDESGCESEGGTKWTEYVGATPTPSPVPTTTSSC